MKESDDRNLNVKSLSAFSAQEISDLERLFRGLQLELSSRVREKLKGSALMPTQYRALKIIEESGHAISLRTLQELLRVTPGAASTLAKRLLRLGYISAREMRKDRRVILLGLTPKGKRRLRSASEAIGGVMSEFLSPLEASERQEFLRLALKMAGPLERREGPTIPSRSKLLRREGRSKF